MRPRFSAVLRLETRLSKHENIKMWIKPGAESHRYFTHILTFYNNSDNRKLSIEIFGKVELFFSIERKNLRKKSTEIYFFI
ncbi:Uncharacterised protein [Chryseobacterium taihuense]|uniref:Uncharacterized protein n=1 Tax=Chryseobacterium taihuense TaxID=1141221 RepID=A0A4U8WD53_9FLAO|nr:Uncharacterised protein [Chryseobacterium taihuense]VFB04282.1 Uncharacterised protein [Chryseobacterium taihuense]VFB04285.1 Uncharacterised protein [Chryseobacterium taihuense]